VGYLPPFQLDILKLVRGKIGIKIRRRQTQESGYCQANCVGISGAYAANLGVSLEADFGNVKIVESSGFLERGKPD